MRVFLKSYFLVRLNRLHTVKGEIEEFMVCHPRAEEKPPVAVLFQQVWPYDPVLGLGTAEWLVTYRESLLVGDIIV